MHAQLKHHQDQLRERRQHTMRIWKEMVFNPHAYLPPREIGCVRKLQAVMLCPSLEWLDPSPPHYQCRVAYLSQVQQFKERVARYAAQRDTGERRVTSQTPKGCANAQPRLPVGFHRSIKRRIGACGARGRRGCPRAGARARRSLVRDAFYGRAARRPSVSALTTPPSLHALHAALYTSQRAHSRSSRARLLRCRGGL